MTTKESISDPRNFRMLYYEQLGLRNVDQMKALDCLLKEDPLDIDKLRKFTQQFSLPALLRSYVWKVLLDIIPIHKESAEFTLKHRTSQFTELKEALITMGMITFETKSSKTIVLLYLLEHGMLSILHNCHLKKDGFKVCILNSISDVVSRTIHDECDSYWITKRLFNAQGSCVSLFAKLPKCVKSYLQLEDQRLFEHLCDIQLFKMLPYDRWFQTYFTSVFSESLEYLACVWDKIVAGSGQILVFVCVSLLLVNSIQLKELSCDAALKLISNLSQENGYAAIDKTMELWEQHYKSLSVELGCF